MGLQHLSLVVNKHRAHRALLGHPQFVELRSTYREANGKVKRAVANVNIFTQKQVEVVKCL